MSCASRPPCCTWAGSRRAARPGSCCRPPPHPYTQALRSAVPEIDWTARRTRVVLPGEPPDAASPPPGCVFHPRCPLAVGRCRTEVPLLRPVAPGRLVACHRAEEVLAGAGHRHASPRRAYPARPPAQGAVGRRARPGQAGRRHALAAYRSRVAGRVRSGWPCTGSRRPPGPSPLLRPARCLSAARTALVSGPCRSAICPVSRGLPCHRAVVRALPPPGPGSAGPAGQRARRRRRAGGRGIGRHRAQPPGAAAR